MTRARSVRPHDDIVQCSSESTPPHATQRLPSLSSQRSHPRVHGTFISRSRGTGRTGSSVRLWAQRVLPLRVRFTLRQIRLTIDAKGLCPAGSPRNGDGRVYRVGQRSTGHFLLDLATLASPRSWLYPPCATLRRISMFCRISLLSLHLGGGYIRRVRRCGLVRCDQCNVTHTGSSPSSPFRWPPSLHVCTVFRWW